MKIAAKFLVLPALSLSLLLACGSEPPPPPAAPPPPPAAPPPPPPAPMAAVAPVPVAPKLALQVITGSPEGFLVNSTLVTGDKEAVLIDAELTLADGKKAAEAVTASKKTLTTVFVTHWHPDHYFGFSAIKEVFPNAKLVALPATVEEISKSWEAKVKQWKPMFKDAIPAKPILPEPLVGDLTVDGVKLEVVGAQQGDATNDAYVWIPSLKAVVAGDIVYDDVFPWTAETTPDTRKAWAATLDKLSALNPEIVVPGHQKADRKQAPTSIAFTKTYLAAFDEALASSKKPAELQAKIKAKYPDAALDIIVKFGAEAAFAKPEKPKAEKPAPAPKPDKPAAAPKAEKPAAPKPAAAAAAPAKPAMPAMAPAKPAMPAMAPAKPATPPAK